MLELRSKALLGVEEWQGQLKEWCSLNTGGTIPSRGWMWQFLVSKALGVALLWLQAFLSKFIGHRGIVPRPPLTAASGEVGALIRFGMQEKRERAVLGRQ